MGTQLFVYSSLDTALNIVKKKTLKKIFLKKMNNPVDLLKKQNCCYTMWTGPIISHCGPSRIQRFSARKKNGCLIKPVTGFGPGSALIQETWCVRSNIIKNDPMATLSGIVGKLVFTLAQKIVKMNQTQDPSGIVHDGQNGYSVFLHNIQNCRG